MNGCVLRALGETPLWVSQCIFLLPTVVRCASLLHTTPVTLCSMLCYVVNATYSHIASTYYISYIHKTCERENERSHSLRPHESQHARLPVHHQLPEFTQTHVHRVGDAIQPSHSLSSPSPPAPNPSQHQNLLQ